MRIKAIFSVFARKLPSKKTVYYYHCYDEKGKRQWAKSTGLAKKSEAIAYCMKLFKDGLLIPEQKVPTFAEFSSGWRHVRGCGLGSCVGFAGNMCLTIISLSPGSITGSDMRRIPRRSITGMSPLRR